MSNAHIDLLRRLHPRGAISLDDATYLSDLAVLGGAFDLADEQRRALLDEALPDRAESLLSRWERVYAIRRVAGRTASQRRNVVLAKRRLLPDFRPATIVDICEQLTACAATILEMFAFRCDEATSVCDSADDGVDGAFFFYVDFARADVVAAGVDRDELDEMIAAAKPSHVYGRSRMDTFSADDAYSLTDRDLLGS